MDSLLPRLRIDTQSPPPRLDALFETPVEKIALEIGFGAGEHLAARAQAHPGWGFLGCEVYINGIAALLGLVEEHSLRNVRLHDADARDLLGWLPDGSVDQVFILFPDPWPKKRHHKRRLISRETLQSLARIMRAGARLRVASDIPDYIRTALIEVRRSGEFDWAAESATDWRERPADWPETRYEAKAIREGRRCSYLTFIRCRDALGTDRE